jgi:hypothetical protein
LVVILNEHGPPPVILSRASESEHGERIALQPRQFPLFCFLSQFELLKRGFNGFNG